MNLANNAYPISEHQFASARHTSAYLACGRVGAPLVIFIHGWPELGLLWRQQLVAMAGLGFRAVAPDMRGYGNSSIYLNHADYALEHSVTDMLELLDHLGGERAIWVGHDWGSPVAWAMASHHPQRCHGVANLCVPYLKEGFTLGNMLPLVDRSLYPQERLPYGQWDYQQFYQEQFEQATASLDANVSDTVRALFRKSDPAHQGKPSRLAYTRSHGGWFGGTGKAPAVPLDTDVLSEHDHAMLNEALQRNGFIGPNAWYMNHERNGEYAMRAFNAGKLTLPVLFFHATLDFTCETVQSRLAEPMRADCSDLTEVAVPCGHWMAQEQPIAVNAGLAKWLAGKFPQLW